MLLLQMQLLKVHADHPGDLMWYSRTPQDVAGSVSDAITAVSHICDHAPYNMCLWVARPSKFKLVKSITYGAS